MHQIVLNVVLFGCLLVTASPNKKDNVLTARDLLESIAPSYQLVKLPPGFPPLGSINTDKFSYKTTGNLIRVSANFDKPVVMFKDFIKISQIKMNFTFDKSKPNNSWEVSVKGSLVIGSSVIEIAVNSSGDFKGNVRLLRFKDIVSEFFRNNTYKEIGIESNAILLGNATVEGKITKKHKAFSIIIKGLVTLDGIQPFRMEVNIVKQPELPINIYSVFEVKNEKPEKILKEIMNQKTLNIPFFAHMLAGSSLFSVKKKIFGIAFSYDEVYNYKDSTLSGTIIEKVLQSHVPLGVTLLFPLQLHNLSVRSTDSVNTAFVIKEPNFDLLIAQSDKMSVKSVITTVSKEFTSASTKIFPEFISKNLEKAFTTHVSFDSSTSLFSIFVRLQEDIELVPNLIRISVSNFVLQRAVALDNKITEWTVSAKGILKIGKSNIQVQYAEISDEAGKPYGLTGSIKKLPLEDIIEQFDPDFYPSNNVKDMIENTEISNLIIRKVRLFSRVPRLNGTPHILITGLTNLPAFEKDIQLAMLLIYKSSYWHCKWVASFKHTPLSNIIQALTGFESLDINLLHNSKIMTTLISSPLATYSLLPPHIITTPLLRLPVKKALTIIALLRFPDNCGDDKMCITASHLLDVSKLFTLKGTLDLEDFYLNANIPYNLNLSSQIHGINNTLQFTIGKKSRLDIKTTIKFPSLDLVFDGNIHILKNGDAMLELFDRYKIWEEPFGLQSLSFMNLNVAMKYRSKADLRIINVRGLSLLGINKGYEISAPLKLELNPLEVYASNFYVNFSTANLPDLMKAFNIQAVLPNILKQSSLPTGFVLIYNGRLNLEPAIKLKGDITIFERRLKSEISIIGQNFIRIVTENSPAPLIFAKGQIIIQQDAKIKIRGPKLIADITSDKAKVVAKGFVKILGIEDDVEVTLDDNSISFVVTGKLMDYKETTLTAYSTVSTDTFQVFGCLADIAKQVQDLLIETISKSANQSIANMEKADNNLINAQKYYEKADMEESTVRNQRDRARIFYEQQLLEYGRFEVMANDTCVTDKCQVRCFGCPKLNQCCRLDIFGHCIACSSWKKCCWKNINPLCISKHDGCHVIRTAAEKVLSEKEASIIQHGIELDNLEQLLTKSEINKGKHQAVLEAALDAKEIIEEDSSPGLNGADAIRNFGSPYGWAKINSVCYNTSIEQASTGCMQFHVAVVLFDKPEKNISIWSCLKEDLVTVLTESLANYVFPNIIDTTLDDVSSVTAQLNEAHELPDSVKIDENLNQDTSKILKIVDEIEEKTNNMVLPLPNPTSQINLPDSIEDGDFGIQAPYYLDYNVETNSTIKPSPPSKAPEYSESIVDNEYSNNHLNKSPLQLHSSNFKPFTIKVETSKNNDKQTIKPVLSQVNISSPTDYPVEIKISAPIKVDGFIPFSGSASGETSTSGSASSAGDELKQILNKNNIENKYFGEDDEGSTDSKNDDNSAEDLAEDLVTEEELEQDLPSKAIKNKLKKVEEQPKLLSKDEQEMKEILEKGTKNKSKNKTKSIFFPSFKEKNKTSSSNNTAGFKIKEVIKTLKLKKRRFRRDTENHSSAIITKTPFFQPNNNALFSNPFWNVKPDRGVSTKSFLPSSPQHQMMTNMIRKRWKIPENPNGRCHIFHQLIAICRDMAETIQMLYKSLTVAKRSFHDEDKNIYSELFEAEEFILSAGKRINIKQQVMKQASNTLNVVRQGVNIWSKRCTNEFEWQNQSGIQSWLQAMDLRIQELGGFGVYRFLENLFHAFEALFEVLTYTDGNTARNALNLLQRIRKVSINFDRIFKEKLPVSSAHPYASDILNELEFLRKDSLFCSI
ncbi:uncharacterized protein LOC100212597 isoform X1 [Hydra vulgaris]|uniref:uncharacterized protein LOC100212597 isoform X1 n=2 Tax=Hydra vulgaris TaxID=6087 RepID=UPI001F5E9E13|nr:uncharacterized protein LOC100212597 isoform X1 [Hydra vulgaris]